MANNREGAMTPAAGPIDSILAAAVEIDDIVERGVYLQRACVGDADLRRRVEELIENHFRAGSFLESPADLPEGDEPAVREQPGAMVGPYKLLEQIGEGGFG